MTAYPFLKPMSRTRVSCQIFPKRVEKIWKKKVEKSAINIQKIVIITRINIIEIFWFLCLFRLIFSSLILLRTGDNEQLLLMFFPPFPAVPNAGHKQVYSPTASDCQWLCFLFGFARMDNQEILYGRRQYSGKNPAPKFGNWAIGIELSDAGS